MTISGHMLRMAAANQAGGLVNYAAFLAHITDISNSEISGAGNPIYLADGLIRITSLEKAGNMLGTPWGNHVFYEAPYNRIAQHGFLSEALFDQQIANNAQILCSRLTITPQVAFTSLSRNGYTSTGRSDGPFQARTCSRLIYWDFSLNAAFEMNPYAQTGPVPYIE